MIFLSFVTETEEISEAGNLSPVLEVGIEVELLRREVCACTEMRDVGDVLRRVI